MNIIIFSLTVLALYGIIRIGYNAFKNADLEEKMEDLDFIDEQHEDILQYKTTYKGNNNKKRKAIKSFYEE